jgi:hypothetical protein
LRHLAHSAIFRFGYGPAYVCFWHKVRAQLGTFEGTQTGGLPTFDAGNLFTSAFQTRFSGALNAYK